MKKTVYSLLLLFAVSCQNGETEQTTDTLTIAIAANVQFAMEELEEAFEQQSSIALEVIIGSSGKLTAQITQGAPYDLFISANMKYPQSLYENGLTTAPPQVYAYGALVLWTLQEQSDLAQTWQERLKNTHKVAIANPKNAPYGEQAIHALRHFQLYDEVAPKLVLGESIAQTNQYILSGACELGFTAKSVVLSPTLKTTGTWVELPEDSYQPIAQGVVVTTFGAKNHPKASQSFYDFLFSATADQIFKTYGYVR